MSDQETEIKRTFKGAEEAIRACVRKTQDECPHKQGCSPSSVGGIGTYTSIVWHYYDDNVYRGVCTNCLKIFEPGDPDYRLVSLKSGNYSSACGDRVGTQVPITAEVQKEIDSQFCDLDRDQPKSITPTPLSEYIKQELFEQFKEKLYQDFLKDLRRD